jgi:hypothetical protein
LHAGRTLLNSNLPRLTLLNGGRLHRWRLPIQNYQAPRQVHWRAWVN